MSREEYSLKTPNLKISNRSTPQNSGSKRGKSSSGLRYYLFIYQIYILCVLKILLFCFTTIILRGMSHWQTVTQSFSWVQLFVILQSRSLHVFSSHTISLSFLCSVVSFANVHCVLWRPGFFYSSLFQTSFQWILSCDMARVNETKFHSFVFYVWRYILQYLLFSYLCYPRNMLQSFHFIQINFLPILLF